MDNNYIYEWTPHDYMERLEQGKFCLPWLEIHDRVILGGIWMKNHDILFDREN